MSDSVSEAGPAAAGRPKRAGRSVRAVPDRAPGGASPAPIGARGTPGPPATYDQRLATLARALAHPTRVAIVRMLIRSGACACGDIVGRLPLAQSTVSQHLKVLKEAGLIQGTIDPPRVCYCIAPEAVNEAQTLIAALTADSPDVERIG
jgi:ArsR family transcriptional regulator